MKKKTEEMVLLPNTYFLNEKKKNILKILQGSYYAPGDVRKIILRVQRTFLFELFPATETGSS